MAVRKTKSSHGGGCGWGVVFPRERNPETYPCLPSSLTAHSHNNGNVHYNNYSRPPGLNHPFRDTEKVSCPILDLRCFFSLPQYHFSRYWPMHSLHSCTVWFFLLLLFRNIPPGIIDTLAFWKCARVQGVHGSNYWNIADTTALSAFSALWSVENADNAENADVFSFHRHT